MPQSFREASELETEPQQPRDRRLPPVDRSIERCYRGKQLVVTVRENGFEYNGKLYASLSSIARQITGTRWNGFQFFGCTEPWRAHVRRSESSVVRFIPGNPPKNVPTRKTIDIAVQIAEGLAAAHAASIAQRDLKPENVTVRVTQPGTVLGTPNYMSPEQGRGEVADYRSDQFSFGSSSMSSRPID